MIQNGYQNDEPASADLSSMMGGMMLRGPPGKSSGIFLIFFRDKAVIAQLQTEPSVVIFTSLVPK